ncbi:MAG: cell wall hydrolase [Desulfotomaculum sp.]|nr:cell wall hydrolase [Desulfotomaculum sp.]
MKKGVSAVVSVGFLIIILLFCFSGIYTGKNIKINYQGEAKLERKKTFEAAFELAANTYNKTLENKNKEQRDKKHIDNKPDNEQENNEKPAVKKKESAVQHTVRKVKTAASNRGTGRLSDEVYWLARIIHAEAEAEPFIGKVAVGNVILNRVKSDIFPNTIYGVIFDKQYGYTQFSPVIDGRIYNNPSRESIEAAKAALNGYRPVGPALYFLNPNKSENFWIVKNRRYMTTIGKHDFYY